MQSPIKFFFDVETTGVNPRRNSIHQISFLVEVAGEVVERRNFHIRPHPKAEIEEAALQIAGKTKEELLSYPEMGVAFPEIMKFVTRYVSPYEKERVYLVGFNNRRFDDDFFKTLFELCGNTYFFAYFWPDTLDALVLASQYLIDRRVNMPSFKLKHVAIELGLVIDPERLHDAAYGVEVTRQIYRIVTGLELEI